jgi:deoxyribonuclease-1
MLAIPCRAEPTGTGDYDYVKEQLFWEELHPYGGWTLYCGYRFEHDQQSPGHGLVIIDHIYPTGSMLEYAGCNSRMECRESGNALFRQMEADMHNMYPVWSRLVTYRYGLKFGEIPGADQRFDDCDIAWQQGIIQPRTLARGNIARSILYMYQRYGFDLDPETIAMLQEWNRTDAPSEQEKFRNNRIEALQGQRNPYIDNPGLIENLSVNPVPRVIRVILP